MFAIVLLLAASCAAGPASTALADESVAPAVSQPVNRLIDSNDPYLLLHAHNPVDWYPWGQEALDKATREHKPIFLSVGYSTCYWCRVAEETIYSRQEFADLMNPWFVNIKVDREQRPDIDRLYLAATEAMTGHGGWPNNVFLTPELKPFFAGSYFPPHDDASGRPGFDRILRSIHASWTKDPKHVNEIAEKVMVELREGRATAASSGGPIDPSALSRRALSVWDQRADGVHGGFGAPTGPRFPQEPVLSLLLANPTEGHLEVLTRTLDAMAAGGLYDQLAGGFHRYAVEPSWSIPHFEKMLSDNAQLLALYARAFKVTGKPRYRTIAAEVAGYLMTRMMAPNGGFYTAQDAAVDGKEGLSYLWTRHEIESVLGADSATQFFSGYELTPMPDKDALAGGKSIPDRDLPGVLRRRLPVREWQAQTGGNNAVAPAADATPLRARLLQARDRRRQPARDEKLVVALNGLAIEAFVQAGQWLAVPQYIDVARRSAEQVWNVAYDAKSGLKHEIFTGRAQTDAFLDDYALLGLGFLALHDATGDAQWLQHASRLADDLLTRFRRADGSLATTIAESELPMSPPEDGDNIYPSGSAAAVDLLLGLKQSTGDARYGDAAQAVVARLGHRLEEAPESWPSMLLALDEHDVAASTRPAPGALSTRSVVSVSAVAKAGADRDEIEVTLQIDDGYHVNANPATYEYLIATGVAFAGLTPTLLHYPESTLFKPSFAPAGLKVYEGTVTLDAWFPAGTLAKQEKLSAVVAVQACNSEICLPPAKLTVPITRDP